MSSGPRQPLLEPQEVADELKVTVRFVLSLIADGELKAVRFSRKVIRIRPEDLDEFLQRSYVAPSSAISDDTI